MIGINRFENEHKLSELLRYLCDIKALNLKDIDVDMVDRPKYTALHVYYNNTVLSVHADNEHDGIYINTITHHAYKQHTAIDILFQLAMILEW